MSLGTIFEGSFQDIYKLVSRTDVKSQGKYADGVRHDHILISCLCNIQLTRSLRCLEGCHVSSESRFMWLVPSVRCKLWKCV